MVNGINRFHGVRGEIVDKLDSHESRVVAKQSEAAKLAKAQAAVGASAKANKTNGGGDTAGSAEAGKKRKGVVDTSEWICFKCGEKGHGKTTCPSGGGGTAQPKKKVKAVDAGTAALQKEMGEMRATLAALTAQLAAQAGTLNKGSAAKEGVLDLDELFEDIITSDRMGERNLTLRQQ